MKMQKMVILAGIIFLLLGCSASQKTYETNLALDKMMAEKKFEIRVRAAHPLVSQALTQVASSGLIAPGSTISRIDLNGSYNYLKILGDSVSANLSYYGERQVGGGYNNSSGIQFNGIPKDIEISKDDVKQNYMINFNIQNKTESFTVNMRVGINLTSTINITSSHRSRIGYTGVIKELKE